MTARDDLKAFINAGGHILDPARLDTLISAAVVEERWGRLLAVHTRFGTVYQPNDVRLVMAAADGTAIIEASGPRTKHRKDTP